MYGVDLYARVRLAVFRDGLSRREAARRFGIDRGTVAKILRHTEPPGYVRTMPVRRPFPMGWMPPGGGHPIGNDEWTAIFGSERLAGAVLDRLIHHVHIPEMNGPSYRLAQSRARHRS